MAAAAQCAVNLPLNPGWTPFSDRLHVDDLAEQLDQALALGPAQPLGQLRFVLVSDLSPPGQRSRAAGVR